jgi:hypothetical protein
MSAPAVQPHQEVFPGQLRRRDPGQQLSGSEAAIPLFTWPIAVSRTLITPSRSHRSLTHRHHSPRDPAAQTPARHAAILKSMALRLNLSRRFR